MLWVFDSYSSRKDFYDPCNSFLLSSDSYNYIFILIRNKIYVIIKNKFEAM